MLNLIKLRLVLISYQNNHMLLLALAGLATPSQCGSTRKKNRNSSRIRNASEIFRPCS